MVNVMTSLMINNRIFLPYETTCGSSRFFLYEIHVIDFNEETKAILQSNSLYIYKLFLLYEYVLFL